MRKARKPLCLLLCAVLLLSMVGCSAANVSSTNDQYVGTEPAAAAACCKCAAKPSPTTSPR